MGAPNASARGVAFVRGLGGGAHRCGGWCSGRRCAQIRVVRCAGVWWNARFCFAPPFLYDAGPCATDAARVESSGRRAHAVGRRRPAVWHARGLAMGKPWHELAVEKHGHGEGNSSDQRSASTACRNTDALEDAGQMRAYAPAVPARQSASAVHRAPHTARTARGGAGAQSKHARGAAWYRRAL